jgi:methyl-accepting chemotaxis protein
VAIPASFEVRLRTYAIDEETLAARAQVWSLLEPHLERMLIESLRRSAKFAPVLTKAIEANFDRIVEMRKQHIAKLFLRPFDEDWVKDAYAQAELEAEIGVDGRSRIVSARSVLSSFAYVATRAYRFAPNKAARAIDVATRILMIDGANGAGCHQELEVRADRSGGQELINAVEDYARTINGIRASVMGVMKSLNDTSGQLTALAQAASGEANTAAGAAGDTAEHVATTAAAAEELTSSIVHIHDQATKSADMAHRSVKQADQTTATIRSLSEAVDRIGSVVGMISDIAAQTNLLALNATIEAARAGEAGRGFAVVAGEVKLLATQTAKATEEIKQQIAMIQEATNRSAENILDGGKTVSDIALIAEAVSAAVDQQAAATGRIAASAASAASNAVTVANALKSVEQTIGKTQESANRVLGFSRELAGRSAELDAAFNVLMQSASRRVASIREFLALK